jgi:hypothetical protein
MSHRLLALAAVALCGASAVNAQLPGLRPVVTQPVQTQFQQRGVRTVGTASPVPIVVQQQQQALQAAYNQALLWQMYQPPVIINTFPTTPYSPWGYNFPQTGGYSSNWRLNTPTGSLYQSSNVFYRGNTLNWGYAYNQGWPIR